MGKVISKLKTPLHIATGSVTEIITGRKRKREEDEDSTEEISNALEKSLHAPKTKKLLTTTQYIYQALFKEGKNSDLTVMALGKAWKLHKVYLCQSPYFASMFNGSWRESCQDYINIEILDPKINLESLEAVFGSLYMDEIVLEPVGVISVLATARLFQLEDLIDRCAEIMIETINAETAVCYYEAALEYGIKNVQKFAFGWLLINLSNFYSKSVKWLKLIGVELMVKLIASHDLFVMQTEYSIYILLRTWLFLQIYPSYDPNIKSSVINNYTPQTYFSQKYGDVEFLLSKEGRDYEKPFQVLRIKHLLNHHMDLKQVLEDNIIPKKWLNRHLMAHWSAVLKIDQNANTGPGEIDEYIFYENCMRFGRVLQEQSFQKWRWTGFNFGLDLILIADDGGLNIRRHHRYTDNERLLSLQAKRQFLIRVTAVSINEQRQVIHSRSTGIRSITLDKNEEVSLLSTDKDVSYPLLISVNLLITYLDANTFEKNIKIGSTNQISITEIGGDVEHK